MRKGFKEEVPDFYEEEYIPLSQNIDKILSHYMSDMAKADKPEDLAVLQLTGIHLLKIISMLFDSGQLKVLAPEYDKIIKGLDDVDIKLMNLICDGVKQKELSDIVSLDFETIKTRYRKWRTLTGCKKTNDAINKFIDLRIINFNRIPTKKKFERTKKV